jgi:hypothetical protein
MREAQRAALDAASDRDGVERTGPERTGKDLAKRFPVALALYAVLALLVWFTMDAGKVLVLGRPVELRLVPLIIIGGLALRTVLALQADKIRQGREKGGS